MADRPKPAPVGKPPLQPVKRPKIVTQKQEARKVVEPRRLLESDDNGKARLV